MTSPQFIGPLYTNVMYLGAGPFTDFYFICRVSYQQSDDGGRFEVTLTFDARLSNVTKTIALSPRSSSVDVTFDSRDVGAGFGTKVSFDSDDSLFYISGYGVCIWIRLIASKCSIIRYILCAGVVCSAKLLAENTVRVE